VVIVFASYNNQMMSFNLWPFIAEVKISGALAIIGLIVFGYVVAKVDSWFSYSPIRRALSSQKKQNKALDKKQKELTQTISGLQENISTLKAMNSVGKEAKSFMHGLKNMFRRK